MTKTRIFEWTPEHGEREVPNFGPSEDYDNSGFWFGQIEPERDYSGERG